ncbi:hypothetical protein PN498_18405 [Oscillatoria sp. CS-180]|uniref:hypothetical protein n=1 Tax=Oscillatoria sp. CS-180 TaxID=3021720 RepID=UPI00232D7450|nr:hypothetical protein [Oscillatoria sp. CS-180]MDB9527972.1 hypothetical protein [Oscillatoria sp. CS-180]
MNNSEFSSIREQLLALQNETNARHQTPALSEDSARSPDLPFAGMEGSAARQSHQTHQTDMVQALRQRSPQPTPHLETPEVTIPPSVNSHLERLRNEADRINDLYRQQELAIQKFQRTAKALDIILPRQAQGSGLAREQFCELRDAALTNVVQDENGCYVLMAVDIDLNLDEHQASQNAAEIRTYGRSRPQRLRPNVHAVRSLIAEPMAAFETVWQSVTATLENRSPLTPLHMLAWFGGGLISRVALDLALSATPWLWHWIVGAIVGAVVLGLYRLLFSERPDSAFITRLFLALVGLWLGGQF